MNYIGAFEQTLAGEARRHGEVDRNAFYGDENDWTVFLLTGCDPRVVDALGPQGRCQLVK